MSFQLKPAPPTAYKALEEQVVQQAYHSLLSLGVSKQYVANAASNVIQRAGISESMLRWWMTYQSPLYLARPLPQRVQPLVESLRVLTIAEVCDGWAYGPYRH